MDPPADPDCPAKALSSEAARIPKLEQDNFRNSLRFDDICNSFGRISRRSRDPAPLRI
jgi:hypothetical protein